ncbi:MAG: DUF3179 domain-containing protein [Limisphaerales bacterium]
MNAARPKKKLRWGVCLGLGLGVTAVVGLVFPFLPEAAPEVCEVLSAEQLPAAVGANNGFGLGNATIPREQILSGGPPRDGIPAIDRPRFIAPARAGFLSDDDVVVSMTVNGVTRAYPLRILVWHEIVNDELGGTAVAVTFCPLCGTAMVFDRRVGERVLSFGVSGLLYQSDGLMYDRQTESLWSQLKMEAVSGAQVRTRLNLLVSEHLTWAAWRQRHPDGEVLSTETGFARDYENLPYAGYEHEPETIFPVPTRRKELPNKAWVLGVVVDGQAIAFPVAQLPEARSASTEFAGQRLEVLYRATTRHPSVTLDGQPAPHVLAYWFAWQAFYPETRLWQP